MRIQLRYWIKIRLKHFCLSTNPINCTKFSSWKSSFWRSFYHLWLLQVHKKSEYWLEILLLFFKKIPIKLSFIIISTCNGFVTSANCCQDDLCNGHDENSCNSDDEKSIFCKWEKFSSKCLALRDAENKVCCQSKPVAGCSDLIECYHFVSILNSSYFFFALGPYIF